jgi:hypothetical protein
MTMSFESEISIYFPNLLPMYIDLEYCQQRWLLINIEGNVTNTDTVIDKFNANGLVASKEGGYFGNYNELVCQVDTATQPTPSLLTPFLNGRITVSINVECYKIYEDSERFIVCIRNKSRVKLSTKVLDSTFDTIQNALSGEKIDPKHFVPEMTSHTVVF